MVLKCCESRLQRLHANGIARSKYLQHRGLKVLRTSKMLRTGKELVNELEAVKSKHSSFVRSD